MIRHTIATALVSTFIASTAIASLSSCSKDPIQEELIEQRDRISTRSADVADPASLLDTEVGGVVHETEIELTPPIDEYRFKFYRNDDHNHTSRPDGWEDPNQQREDKKEQLTI
jgi:hypothetical protein